MQLGIFMFPSEQETGGGAPYCSKPWSKRDLLSYKSPETRRIKTFFPKRFQAHGRKQGIFVKRTLLGPKKSLINGSSTFLQASLDSQYWQKPTPKLTGTL